MPTTPEPRPLGAEATNLLSARPKDEPPQSGTVIDRTRRWIEEVVVGCNFCPFAKKELRADSIHYRVDTGLEEDCWLQSLSDELRWLEERPATETSLVIFPSALAVFNDYLDFLDTAERLLVREGYESVYQLASFHPLYLFAGSTDEDPANYTNRSIYPMLHLLREASLEEALDRYPEPEKIPTRNIAFARSQGLRYFEEIQAHCRQAID